MNDTKLRAALKEALREVSGMMVKLAGAGSDEHILKEAREAGLAASMAIMDIALALAAPALECGNCFEGKSDLDHDCRKCGSMRLGTKRPVFGRPGTRDVDVAAAQKAWDAAQAQPPAQDAREPLTDAQIIAGAKADWVDEFKDFQCGVKFAEHHHGIK